MIALKDVLVSMEATDNEGNPIPFSLKAVKYDEAKGTGGDFLEVDKAILTHSGKKSFGNDEKVYQKTDSASDFTDKEKIIKNPNHHSNLTRNITILPSGNIRKVHIHLITRFNGERVF